MLPMLLSGKMCYWTSYQLKVFLQIYLCTLSYTYLGQDNKPYLLRDRKVQALRKVSALRKMSDAQVRRLKILPFAKFSKDSTVQLILSEAFQQTTKYVNSLKQKPEFVHVQKFFMHVCVAVGSSKIVYETQA